MKTIWRYIITPNTLFYSMPEGAKILTVKEQNGEVCIWAEVNPDEKIEMRKIMVYGTGHSVPPEPQEYIGTAHLMGGGLVLHVYAGTYEHQK